MHELPYMSPSREVDPSTRQSLRFDYEAGMRDLRRIRETRLNKIHNTDFADVAERNEALLRDNRLYRKAESRLTTE